MPSFSPAASTGSSARILRRRRQRRAGRPWLQLDQRARRLSWQRPCLRPYQGTPIKSGYPGSTATANVLAFNIKGDDPISGTTIPAYTVLEGSRAPGFVTERDKGQLTNLTNASPAQLQQVFSGTNCNASAFGLPAAAINIFINEGISGQGNVAEATVFRHPTVYTGSNSGSVLGLSQEANVGADNPLAGQSARV